MPGFDIAAWQGVIAPAKTPDDIVAKLNTQLNTLVATADVRGRMRDLGMNPVGKRTPDELAASCRMNSCAGGKSSKPPASPNPQ